MKNIPTRRINSPFLIGLFVIIGTVITIGLVIWLGASQLLKEKIYFVTYFENSVEGLEHGSSVKYQGIPVGTVAQIRLAPDGRLIEVIMQIDRKMGINDSLRIKAEIAGIAGGKFLQLFYPNKPELLSMNPKLNFEPPYKLIKSSPSGIDEFEIAAREVMSNLTKFDIGTVSDKTIKFLESSTDFMTNSELKNIIDNISRASERLSAILSRADTANVISNVSSASVQLLQATKELKEFTKILNEKVTDMQLNEYLKMTFLKYDSTMTDARNSINTIGFRTDNILLNFSETLEQLKLTNKQLRKTLKSWTDNPGAVLFSEPPPMEK